MQQRLMYDGKDYEVPERYPLRAGPLQLSFEGGDLRYIRLGQQEVVRRIYVAIRDRNWGTVPNVISDVKSTIKPESFEIRYRATNRDNEIDFARDATITGDESGSITFAFEGEARSTFLRNRIGFCVLHPVRECAGRVCQIEHSDGTSESTVFPKLVAPQLHQNGRPMPHGAFQSIRSMRYPITQELWAEIHFEGDLFELEDQRNWLDASFKTYCTPLQQPFPVEIPKGTRVAQQVRISLSGKIPQMESLQVSDVITLHIREDAAPVPLPSIGIGIASYDQKLSATELQRLQKLHLSYLQAEIDLSKANFEQQLAAAQLQAQALDVPLSVALTLSDADIELSRLVTFLEQNKLNVISWIIFHQQELVTLPKWVDLARQYLAPVSPDALIGGGSKANFAELNRAWPEPALLDFVSFTANPQVHAFDNQSIAETCSTFTDLIETASQATGGKPVIISALTLKPRFNPVATGPEAQVVLNELPPQVDPRQLSLFGAGWTLGCLKYLCQSTEVRQVSYYETTGWLGVLEREQGSPLPEKFPSHPGCVFPIYHVLADIGEMRGGVTLPIHSSQPLLVNGLLLQREHQMRLLIANWDHDEHHVQAALPITGDVSLRFLDETTYHMAACSPEIFRAEGSKTYSVREGIPVLRLLPYAVVCIDFEVKRQVFTGESS